MSVSICGVRRVSVADGAHKGRRDTKNRLAKVVGRSAAPINDFIDSIDPKPTWRFPAGWWRRPVRMTKALSNDLRSRAVNAVAGGMSCRAAAGRFGVAASTVVKWVRRWRDTGTWAPRPQGGDKRSERVEAYGEEILRLVADKVDVTLAEIADRLQREHGERFAPSTVWRFLDRHAMTFKKNRARQRAGAPGRGEREAGLVRRPA